MNKRKFIDDALLKEKSEYQSFDIDSRKLFVIEL